jgi:hypothetical protein
VAVGALSGESVVADWESGEELEFIGLITKARVIRIESKRFVDSYNC